MGWPASLRSRQKEKQAPVAQSSSLISGVAKRYAGSLYDLAADSNAVAAVEKHIDSLETMIAGSDDFQRLIKSPVFSADEQAKAIGAIAAKAGIDGLAGNFLKVVAQNRRLFALPGILKAFRVIAAEARGEVAADVTAAHELSAAQQKELAAALKDVAGKDVKVNLTVDPSILGGLIVKIGSRQIDTSLKTKLNSMKLALKEVG